MNIQVRTVVRQGMAISTARLPTARGAITLRASVPVGLVDRLLQRRMMAGMADGTSVGWGFFKRISKKARKVAKKLAKSRVLKSMLKVATHPAVASLLPGPVVTGLAYLEKGRKLVALAKSGNRKARGLIDQVRAQAQFRKAPTAFNFARVRALQKRNSRALRRPVGDPLFSRRFDRVLKACA